MRALFLAPSYHADLLGQTTFTASYFIPSGSPASSGSFNSPLYGYDIVMADKLSTDVGYACHKSCLSMIFQKGLTVKIVDLLPASKLAYRINAHIVFGIKLMDNKRLVKISG